MKHANKILLLISLLVSFAIIEAGAYYYIHNPNMNHYIRMDAETVNFYEKYYKQMHHLRYLEKQDERYNGKVTDLLFKTIAKSDGNDKTLLIQGDSWGAQVNKAPGAVEQLVAFSEKEKVNVINGGMSSFAPSPMTMQLRVLRSDFDIRPNYIATIIDQTDIGDELCRYQPRLQKDAQGKLLRVDPEPFHSSDIYSLGQYLKKQANLRENNLASARIIKNVLVRFDYRNNKIPKRCGWGEISAPLKNGVTPNQEAHFAATVKGYLDEVFADENVKHLLLINHPHRGHLEGYDVDKYVLYNKTLIEKVVDQHPMRDRISFLDGRDDFKENYKDFAKEDIFLKDDIASHLSDEAFAKVLMPQMISNIRLK